MRASHAPLKELLFRDELVLRVDGEEGTVDTYLGSKMMCDWSGSGAMATPQSSTLFVPSPSKRPVDPAEGVTYRNVPRCETQKSLYRKLSQLTRSARE